MSQEPTARVTGVNQFMQTNFVGGQNEDTSNTLLDVSESPSARNIGLNRKGILEPRKGRKQLIPNDFSDSPVTGLHGYENSSGTKQLVFTVEDKAYSSDLRKSVVYTDEADFNLGVLGDYTYSDLSPGLLILDTPSSGMTVAIAYASQVDWESTTYDLGIDTSTSPGYIMLASSYGYTHTDTTTADFAGCTLSEATAISNKVKMNAGGYTWQGIQDNEWGDL